MLERIKARRASKGKPEVKARDTSMQTQENDALASNH